MKKNRKQLARQASDKATRDRKAVRAKIAADARATETEPERTAAEPETDTDDKESA